MTGITVLPYRERVNGPTKSIEMPSHGTRAGFGFPMLGFIVKLDALLDLQTVHDLT